MIGGRVVEVDLTDEERSRRREAPLVRSLAILSLQSESRSLRPWDMTV